MRDLGLETHVIELGSWLMNQQLDEASAHVLETKIRSMGVQLRMNARSEAILRHESGLHIRFNQGDPLKVDMVVISAGIRANDKLARQAGIDCDISVGGVLVDDRLHTTEPRVYAIGECASHRGRIYGLVGPGYQMAEVLADNLTSRRQKTFSDADLSTRLKLLGVQVSVFGRHRDGDDRLTWHHEESRRTIAVQYGRLIGATAVGDWHQLDEVRRAVDENRRVRPSDLEHFAKCGELWPDQQEAPVRLWPDNRMVCQCASVTCGTLKSAISAGCQTVESLAAETRATTVCGSCRPLVAQLANVDEKVEAVPGWRPLLIASILAAITLALLMAIPDLTVNSSVESAWHAMEALWRNTFWKQVSGFTLLGLSSIALLLSLRKRLKKFSFGHFGNWRVFHAAVGGFTLAALLIHTGGRMGSNLNFMLMTVFLMLNALGAVAGVIVAIEGRSKGTIAFRARQFRPWLVWAHVLLFWPLPMLIAAHVVSVYYF